jgi:hypothetical protein
MTEDRSDEKQLTGAFEKAGINSTGEKVFPPIPGGEKSFKSVHEAPVETESIKSGDGKSIKDLLAEKIGSGKQIGKGGN